MKSQMIPRIAAVNYNFESQLLQATVRALHAQVELRAGTGAT